MPKTPREMERLIMKDGWYFVRQTGSHRHYQHPSKTGLVTIPFSKKTLTVGTEHSILKQAKL